MARRTTIKNGFTTTHVDLPAVTIEPEKPHTETELIPVAGDTELIEAVEEYPVEVDPEPVDDVEAISEDVEELWIAADAILDDSWAHLSLDEDPDTSLVGSVYLHMLSEHPDYDVLHRSDDDAIAVHQQAHRDLGQDHSITDWRFRPGRALAYTRRTPEFPPQ